MGRGRRRNQLGQRRREATRDDPKSLREQLRPLLPKLAHWFHLKAPDLDELTAGEVLAYVEAVVDLPDVGQIRLDLPADPADPA